MLAQARKRPTTLFVGIDPVHSAMIDASRRAAAKPSRGGRPNAMFVQSGLEILPGEFDGIADEITVNYPWGSLLRAVALPEARPLSRLARLAKSGGQIEIQINVHPFHDPAYAARVRLSDALLILDREAFVDAYARAGLIVTDIVDVSANPRATRWGNQLAFGSRQILCVRSVRP